MNSNLNSDTGIDISVIIPTWRRSQSLETSLKHILACRPPPSELWIHIDANDHETASMLEKGFAGRVKWIIAQDTRGPGGGRNALANRANCNTLVSFDDDSWPLDADFFSRVATWIKQLPEAGVLSMPVVVKGAKVPQSRPISTEVASFENCAVAYRREAFLNTTGFLPLRYAYGMEESDLRLQLIDHGWKIYRCDDLNVFHDTNFDHHGSVGVNSHHIANLALLAVLRYPLWLWPYGLFQVANRVVYSLRTNRIRGILKGLVMIPGHCWRHRLLRKPVRSSTVLRTIRLRRGNG